MKIRNIVDALIYNSLYSSYTYRIRTLLQIHYYNEGDDRVCRELENGTIVPVFHTDDFILKVTEDREK